MPSPGSPLRPISGQDTARDAEPYYSNEDVAILHDIVVLAQELLPKLPDRERLPTNALFSAYYDILPRSGVNVDHDSRYARILFKIGGLRGQGNLYEKFREILSRMGIEIEFESEGDQDENEDTHSETRDVQFEVFADGSALREGTNEAREVHQFTRRNSESSVWDGGNDSLSRKRRNSFSYIPNIDSRVIDIEHRLQPSSASPAIAAHHSQQIGEGVAQNARAWLDSKAVYSRRGRERSVSTHASMRVRRRSASMRASNQKLGTSHSIPASDEYHAESEITAATSLVEHETMGSAKSSQADVYNQAIPSLLDIKASVVHQDHLFLLAKQQLILWRDKAEQIQRDSHGLWLIAVKHDRQVLLQGAFADWRHLLRVKQVSHETEAFFLHLEERALRARNLYLMHIAFTHWQVCADEHVQRVALARRHVVRTRIFHAWREISAVSELKVRRYVLNKFFGNWKRKCIAQSAFNVDSTWKYEENLVRRLFTGWLQKHHTTKALTFWAENSKRQTLFRWIVVSHDTWEDQMTAERYDRFQAARNPWRVWKTRTQECVQQGQAAASFYSVRSSFKMLRKWRRETQVLPAKRTLQHDAETRLLQLIFRTWLLRLQQEKQAAAVDRVKILREAWVTWHFKNRALVVTARVDFNAVAQSIYKWVLAARYSQATRVAKTRSKETVIQHWSNQAYAQKAWRLEQEKRAWFLKVQSVQAQALRIWHEKSEQQKLLDVTATRFSGPRLLQQVISKWAERMDHVNQLQKWSHDANFYFATSKTLKLWKASTESAKREKRRLAYIHVRRSQKITLARGILQKWNRRAREIADIQRHASHLLINKSLVVGMNTFDRWRAQAEEIAEMDALGIKTLIRKHFNRWLNQSLTLHEWRAEAVLTYQERRQNRAVRKWRLQNLQIGAQHIYAVEVHEKNIKRNFRKIFKYWHHKASQIKLSKMLQDEEEDHLVGTASGEAWSDFSGEEDGWAGEVDEASTSIQVPGYLSTPSRRTERVMAVAARYSTTPKIPLSTPFERQLRAQYSGSLLPSIQRLSGRSTLGLTGGFANLHGKDTSKDENRSTAWMEDSHGR